MMRLFRPYEIPTTNTTIRALWEKIGFGYVQRDPTYFLSVHKGKIRPIPEFAEIWQINYSPAQLSGRRRQHKWG
jgi:hypothetical protein